MHPVENALKAGERHPSNLPARQMFQRQHPRLVDTKAFKTLLSAFVERSGKSIGELAGLDLEMKLESVDQQKVSAIPDGIAVVGLISEWKASTVVRIDPHVLFGILEGMFGGDPLREIGVPLRSMTGIEMSLAVLLASIVLSEFKNALEDRCPFSIRDVTCLEESLAATFGHSLEDYVVMRMTMLGVSGAIMVAVPLFGLEHVNAELSQQDGQAGIDLDPDWSMAFRHNVLDSSIWLKATLDGPATTLGEISRLVPGVLLELDPETLWNVHLESETQPVFIGKLGQSRGFYTMLVEKPGGPGVSSPT